MTLCIGVKVSDGLVGLADTRVTSGTERTIARKLTVHQRSGHCLFLMTSGLRSIRDKAVTYFEEAIAQQDETFAKLYQATNAFARQIRRVADEDREAIESSGLAFDVAAIVGGQLEQDDEPKLYLLYPQGNWVEVSQGTPFSAIGEGGYGKSILDRGLAYDTSMEDALKIAYLAFDATRTSATDVGYPIDVVLYARDSYRMVERRYVREELQHVAQWWHQRMRQSIDECPSDWVHELVSQLDAKVVPLDPARGTE